MTKNNLKNEKKSGWHSDAQMLYKCG